MKFLEHKGYTGTFEIEDDAIVGKIVGIRDLVTFEADRPGAAHQAFAEAVDDYLADCAAEGREPDKPFKGRFQVRIRPKTHRDLALLAERRGTNLNALTAEALDDYVAKHAET